MISMSTKIIQEGLVLLKMKNWDRVRKKPAEDSIKFRDVYEDQQFERSKIQDKQTMTSRTILTIVCTLFVGALTYLLISLGVMAFAQFSSAVESAGSDSTSVTTVNGESGMTDITAGYESVITPDGERYRDANGNMFTWDELQAKYNAEHANDTNLTTTEIPGEQAGEPTVISSVMGAMAPTTVKVLITLIVMLIFFAIMEQYMMRNLDAQNLMNDTSDINQYANDQHIQLPEEVQRHYDFFPDVGAHSSVQVSSMLSHVMLANKGIKKVEMPVRAEKDIVDEDGEIEFYEGEIVLDDNDNATYKSLPMMDKEFGDALYEASDVLDDVKCLRKYYDATKIPYNPGNKNRGKVKNCETVADLINNDWVLPDYEPQRPAGAYIVDTEPVNTIKFLPKICCVINA